MKTVTYDVYTIDEHPSKRAVFEWIRVNWWDLGQFYIDDLVASLKGAQKALGGKLDYSISIGPDRGQYIYFTGFDRKLLRGLHKHDCPFTGMCYDIDVIEALRKNDMGSLLTMLHEEGEYIYSDEGLAEHCEANEYYFKKDGGFDS